MKTGLSDFFLFSAAGKIKNRLPAYVYQTIIRLIPVYFIVSLFEIFGLFVIFPVIKVILEPGYIKQNSILFFLFTKLGFSSVMSFSLFLFTSVTLIFVLKNVILFFASKRQTDVTFELASRLSFEKYNSYINQSYDFHSKNNSGVLLRNITQLPFELVTYLILPFIAIINEFVILLMIVGIIVFYSPLLFFSLIVFTSPFLLIYGKVYKKRLKDISARRDGESAIMYKTVQQSMEAYREIVVFGKTAFFKPVFNKTLKNYTTTQAEVYLMNLFSPKIVEMVAVLGIFSVFIAGYLFSKEMSVIANFLIVFSIAAFRIIPSLNKIILCSNYIKSSSYMFSYFEPSETVNSKMTTENSKPIVFTEKLELKNLSFHYPGRDKLVLNDLTFRVEKGKTIGIIGPSGSGKTTLLNILLRLYEETSGGIYIDDRRIDFSDHDEWYKLLSYVPQNITLLDGTIEENIAFGIAEKEINKALLDQVIAQAQLGEFIKELPDGVRTPIGEKGIRISGGQRQRLGIARALYHGGKILIFDEATSALDYETEKMLTESIRNIGQQTDITIIIVAHRLQTLEYCDEIYEIREGKISVPVSYNELIKAEN